MEFVFANWRNFIEIIYVLAVLVTVLRAVADTRNSTKTLAYVLAILFLPFLGIIIYYSFGINYRKRKLYSRKLLTDRDMAEKVQGQIAAFNQEVIGSGLIPSGYEMPARYHGKSTPISLTTGNKVEMLINGEVKFPRMLKAIEQARHHIHMEYYIYEDDDLGNRLADLLVKKAGEGVEVRLIFDDFGSHGLRKKLVKRLVEGGVKAEAFYRVRFYALANSLNYRNHRKITVIDGELAFVGGINVSDRYVNEVDTKSKSGGLYWRDTHLEIKGSAALALQYIFLADWNFVSGDKLEATSEYFPISKPPLSVEPELVQVVASGPDSEFPTILYSILSSIHAARRQLWITTPYFIPTESLLDALVIAARSGVDVKLLTPGQTDSRIVRAASRSYYSELLRAGVEVYEYQKGFVHAKTMVVDEAMAMVGTANMDLRSFDLNFEVNAILYGEKSIADLRRCFLEDLKDSLRIEESEWRKRRRYIFLYERFIRLISPLL